jgi:branched-chain amino acid transport system ATP-binding protein
MSADSASKGAILEVEHLAKRFGGVVATDDVSLAIESGGVHCVIGPNGAGKSTFFSLLCGIQQPDAGRILFEGREITRLLPFARVRLGLGLTFQTNRTFGELSVRQNLAVPMALRSAEAEERYRYALERFELSEILMVLAGGPRVVLLDEPTAGMSPEETSHTAKVLRHLNATGLTIVVVEHDIAFVREVASRVTVMHYGRIFADGPLADVTARQDVRDIYLGRV